MTWLSQTTLLGIVLGYLVFLFAVATLGEAFASRVGSGPHPHPDLCARRLRLLHGVDVLRQRGARGQPGLEFLTIYLGPACVALLWPVFLRKLVRVSKDQRITSISDFISSRYGKSAALGSLVAVLVVCGMIPYIALQLKAVSASFKMIAPRGLGAGRLRPDAAGRHDPRPVRDPVRRAEPRLHQAADRAHDRRRRGVRGEAPRLPACRRLRHVGSLRGLRRSLRADRRPPGLVSSPRPRPAGDRLLRAVDGDARDLHGWRSCSCRGSSTCSWSRTRASATSTRSPGRSRSTCS